MVVVNNINYLEIEKYMCKQNSVTNYTFIQHPHIYTYRVYIHHTYILYSCAIAIAIRPSSVII